jgi:hypothetical protein
MARARARTIVNAAQFATRRARLVREHHGHGRKYQRALAHLIRDARAILVVMNRKVIGYRLLTGEIVCIKERYRSEDAANDAMVRIQANIEAGRRAPVRVYACPHCHGFHLTSQKRNAAA